MTHVSFICLSAATDLVDPSICITASSSSSSSYSQFDSFFLGENSLTLYRLQPEKHINTTDDCILNYLQLLCCCQDLLNGAQGLAES